MITKISHIGIAVKNLEEAARLYTGPLGLKLQEIENIPARKLRAALIPVGESKIELLESTDPEGTIAQFIDKRGEGLHHLAFEVDDIDAVLRTLKAQGIPLIDEVARPGVAGSRVAFLHPKATKILIEFVEPAK